MPGKQGKSGPLDPLGWEKEAGQNASADTGWPPVSGPRGGPRAETGTGVRERESVRRAACGFGHPMGEPLDLGRPCRGPAGVAGILAYSPAPRCPLSVPGFLGDIRLGASRGPALTGPSRAVSENWSSRRRVTRLSPGSESCPNADQAAGHTQGRGCRAWGGGGRSGEGEWEGPWKVDCKSLEPLNLRGRVCVCVCVCGCVC